MAEEFQGGICGGGNWWSSSRNMLLAVGGLSSCSMGIGDLTTYGWPPTTTTDDFLDIKPRSCSTDHHSNSVSDNSVLFQDNPKPQNSDSDNNNNNLLFDSTLQMMGFALSSSSDWNQNDLLYNDQIRKDWSPSNLCGDININSLKQAQAQEQAGADHDFFLNQNRVNSINCSSDNIDSTLYGYPSKMLQQSLYDSEPDPLQDHQSLFNTGSNNNSFCPNSNDLSLSSPNFPSYLKPSLPKHPLPAGLNFINNTPFWNASAAAASTDVRQGLVPSSQSQVLASILEDKILKANGNAFEDGQDSGSVLKKSDKNSTTEPLIKRPRIETPSPLPTFKVRKEKLGDRVTALQQLVSPFGKTDTASVLHEAIEYIKFLHDQVSVLSTPYMKSNNGAPIQIQQVTEKLDPDCPKQDLRTRGLCLVPISSTFPVTNATPSDFWTPTFGGTFR